MKSSITIIGIITTVVGIVLIFTNRRIANVVAQFRSYLFAFDRVPYIPPRVYRIPVILIGIIIAVLGLLVAVGLINVLPK